MLREFERALILPLFRWHNCLFPHTRLPLLIYMLPSIQLHLFIHYLFIQSYPFSNAFYSIIQLHLFSLLFGYDLSDTSLFHSAHKINPFNYSWPTIISLTFYYFAEVNSSGWKAKVCISSSRISQGRGWKTEVCVYLCSVSTFIGLCENPGGDHHIIWI